MGISPPKSSSSNSLTCLIIGSDDNLILDLHEITGNSSSSTSEQQESLHEETADNPVDSPKIAKIPRKPSQEEIDEHEVRHYPWRS